MEVTHPQNGSLSGLVPSRIGICNSWNFWLLRRGENRSKGRKTPQSEEENQNKLNPHMTSTWGFELGPHLWEASTITTAPSLASQNHKLLTVDDYWGSFLSLKVKVNINF